MYRQGVYMGIGIRGIGGKYVYLEVCACLLYTKTI